MSLTKDKNGIYCRRALITGASGFVGEHLARSLTLQGWQVFGFDRHRENDQKNWYVGDLMSPGILANAMKKCQPDVVFHLAGLLKSSQPESLYRANLLGTIILFESLLESGQRPMVIVASSSAVYGSGFGGRPITEKFRPRPLTHYAVSKLAQETAALRYFDAFQLPVIIVRMFNLLGPGQSPDLACSAFARQIVRAELCGEDEIITGDLSARRDFIDVRDAVRALALVAEMGKAGQIYNICSGHGVLIKKCLNEMLSLSPRQFRVVIDTGNFQEHDIPVQIGDPRKLKQVTGWQPRISLKRSLSDLLEHWRQRVKSGLE